MAHGEISMTDTIPRKALNEWGAEIYKWAKEKGWWEVSAEERNFGELLALIHSEVSEALESWRMSEPASFERAGKPEGWGIELVDVLIRVLDMMHAHGLDIEQLMETKMAHNRTREYRHGGKRASLPRPSTSGS